MGGEHHRYYKHTKVFQNPRGDLKFLVDLTWNDPWAYKTVPRFKLLASYFTKNKVCKAVTCF